MCSARRKVHTSLPLFLLYPLRPHAASGRTLKVMAALSLTRHKTLLGSSQSNLTCALQLRIGSGLSFRWPELIPIPTTKPQADIRLHSKIKIISSRRLFPSPQNNFPLLLRAGWITSHLEELFRWLSVRTRAYARLSLLYVIIKQLNLVQNPGDLTCTLVCEFPQGALLLHEWMKLSCHFLLNSIVPWGISLSTESLGIFQWLPDSSFPWHNTTIAY